MKIKYWFKAKEYGWGWYPASWQGWLCLVAFAAINVYVFMQIDESAPTAVDSIINYIIPFAISLAVLLSICFIKGEKPRWRWGK